MMLGTIIKKMKTKVLIIYSINDSKAQRRIELLGDSPQTEDYEIKFVFAIKDFEDNTQFERLVYKINLAIKSFKPDYVIFHTGCAFHLQPRIFQNVVIELKRTYENIKFSYEPINTPTCRSFFDSLGAFDKSKESAEIIYLLFFKIFNRKIADELWIQQLL